jgi:hypothetical protein
LNTSAITRPANASFVSAAPKRYCGYSERHISGASTPFRPTLTVADIVGNISILASNVSPSMTLKTAPKQGAGNAVCAANTGPNVAS